MMSDIRHELRKFAETTSIKGVGRVVRTTNKVTRFFWLAAIVVCSAFLLFQLEQIVMNYVSHTVTRVAKVNPNTPNFPDLTVCNLFPNPNLSVNDYNEYLGRVEMLKDYVSRINTSINEYAWVTLKAIEYYNVNSPILEDNGDDGFLVECNQYGWDLYWATRCTSKSVLVPPLQRCHQIELDWSNGTVAAVSMVLFVNGFYPLPIDNYNSWIRMSTGSGIRLMIHPRFAYPNPKNSIHSPTGNELLIQLQQTNTTRLPYPYGNCTKNKSIVISENVSVLYTEKTCISLCRQQQRIDHCRCLDNNDLFTAAHLEQTNSTFCCNFTGIRDGTRESIERHSNLLFCIFTFTQDESKCDCPMRCSDTDYDVTVSSSQWPDPLYQLSFYKQYIQNNTRYGTKFSVYDDILRSSENGTGEETLQQIKNLHLIEDNFARISIMFSMETYQVLTDTGAITWDTLVANLGGTFNLWLGISVSTFAEIIELIYSILIATCRKRKIECKMVDVNQPGRTLKEAF